MYTVFVARTTGGMVVQKDFEVLEQARGYYDQLFAEKPYEGVMVMLLRREGYYRSFLVDAGAVPSTINAKADTLDTARLEAGLGGA